MPAEDVAPGIVRILGADGQPVGMGVLATAREVLTCAHVVARAAGTPDTDPAPPVAAIELDFPLVARGTRCQATVVHWQPARADWSGDFAVLRLSEAPPEGSRPAQLVTTEHYWDQSYAAFGCPNRSPDGVWASGRMRAPQAAGLVQLVGDSADHQITHGFSGAPVYADKLGGVVGLAVAIEGGKAHTAYVKPTSSLLEGWPELRRHVLPPCPYPGLATFGEADASVFFGRDEDADDLITRVLRDPVVAVVGPSGCGKSSLVFAGVLPRLRRRGDVAFAWARPGRRPAAEVLATALTPLLGPYSGETARAAERSGFAELIAAGRLAELIDRVLEKNERQRLVLYIDQFEECLSSDVSSLADELLGLLLGAAGERLHVVLSLRSDALDALLTGRAGHGLQDAVYLLGPLSDHGLRSAIEQPVEDLGTVRFQGDLTERIVTDSGTAANRISLVQFTLEQLWHEQHNGELTHDAYRGLGGVAGALATYAEQVWNEQLSATEQVAARRLFSQLVYPAPDGTYLRRMAYGQDLAADLALTRVARKLAGTRLVASGRDELGNETYELAHESLITGWQRLADWLADDHEFRLWQENLRQDRQRWQDSGSDTAGLLRGSRLTEADTWLRERGSEVAEPDRLFVTASSLAGRKALRRRRMAITALVIVTVGAVIAATVAIVQSRALGRSNDRLNTSLETAAADLLATRADRIGRTSVASEALLTAAAYRTADTEATRSALLDQHLRLRHTDQILLEGQGDIQSFSVSRDGRRLVAIVDTERTLRQVESRGTTQPPVGRVFGLQYELAQISPDGEHLATYNSGFQGLHLQRYDDVAGQTLVPPLQPVGSDPRLSFSPDSQRLMLFDPVAGLTVWDVPTGKRVGTPPPDVGAVAEFASDATIVYQQDGPRPGVGLWNPETGERRVLIRELAGDRIVVSSDGSVVVRCGENRFELWDVRTGAERPSAPTMKGCPTAVGPGGHYVVAPAVGSAWALYNPGRRGFAIVDPVTGQARQRDLPETASTTDMGTGRVAFVGEGTDLGIVTSDGGGTIVRSEVRPPTPLDTELSRNDLGEYGLDDTGRFLATLNSEATRLRLWDVRSGRQLAERSLPAPTDWGPLDIVDGKVVAAIGERDLLVFRIPDLEPVGRLTLPEADRPSRADSDFTEFTGADNRYLTVMRSGVLSMWDLDTMRMVGKPTPNPFAENTAIRPGHRQSALELIQSGTSSGIMLWDFATDREAARLLLDTTVSVKQLRFDPTGTVLAVVTDNGALEIWDVERRRRLGSRLESAKVESILAFPDRHTLITLDSTQSSVSLNPDRANVVVRDLSHDDPSLDDITVQVPSAIGVELGLAPDGKSLIMAAGKSDVITVPRNPGAWLAGVCRVVDRDLGERERELLPHGAFTQNPCE